MISKGKFIVSIVTLICIVFVLFSEYNFLVTWLSLVYLLQLVSIIYSVLIQKNNRYFLFSPSFITLLYLNLNFVFGHYAVSRGYGFDLKYYNAFISYDSLAAISIVMMIANLAVFLALDFNKFGQLKKVINKQPKIQTRKLSKSLILLLLLIVFILNIVTIDLSFLGGAGDFSYVFKLSTACYLVSLLAFNKEKLRFVIYLVLLTLFVLGSFDSKREIIYVLILILFLEVMINKIDFNLNIKQILVGLVICGLFFYIVMVSSIMRGYGNYDTSSPIEAASKVGDYLESDIILNGMTANFELNSVYGNSTNSINYVLSDQVDLLYGTTFIKFLFIPIPRSVFPDKPESMINVYTTKFAPEFRSIGGSYPIILYSEALWNFHFLGLFVVFLIYRVINNMYINLLVLMEGCYVNVRYMYFMFMYVSLIQFVRGSGFEIWFLYGVLSLPLSLLYSKFYRNRIVSFN